MRNTSSDNSFSKDEDYKFIENTFIRCKNCDSIVMDHACLSKHLISIHTDKTVLSLKLKQFTEIEKKLFNHILIEEKKIQCSQCKLKIGTFTKGTLTCILVKDKIFEEKFSFKKDKYTRDIVLVKQYDLQNLERLNAATNMINYLKKINKNCITEVFYEIGVEMMNIHEKIDKLEKQGY